MPLTHEGAGARPSFFVSQYSSQTFMGTEDTGYACETQQRFGETWPDTTDKCLLDTLPMSGLPQASLPLLFHWLFWSWSLEVRRGLTVDSLLYLSVTISPLLPKPMCGDPVARLAPHTGGLAHLWPFLVHFLGAYSLHAQS